MQTMLTFLLAGLATYYETYNRSIPYAAASLASAPKYILFPEQRAKKVIFEDFFLRLIKRNEFGFCSIMFSVQPFFVIVTIYSVNPFGI